jgi:hypothetical protein
MTLTLQDWELERAKLLTHTAGGPLRTIFTLNALNGAWVARVDSDFWQA